MKLDILFNFKYKTLQLLHIISLFHLKYFK